MYRISRKLFILLFLLGFSLMISCFGSSGDDGDSGKNKVSISVTWDANREKAVNTTGGGYRVYYSKTFDFDISTASYKDVPYVSGDKTPTSTTVELEEGETWYIKVVAYSALGGGAYSEPSAQEEVYIFSYK